MMTKMTTKKLFDKNDEKYKSNYADFYKTGYDDGLSSRPFRIDVEIHLPSDIGKYRGYYAGWTNATLEMEAKDPDFVRGSVTR